MTDDIKITDKSISPRDVDTRHYEVVAEVPDFPFQPGDKFSAWPIGEVFAWVTNRGPILRNKVIEELVKDGRVRLIKP